MPSSQSEAVSPVPTGAAIEAPPAEGPPRTRTSAAPPLCADVLGAATGCICAAKMPSPRCQQGREQEQDAADLHSAVPASSPAAFEQPEQPVIDAATDAATPAASRAAPSAFTVRRLFTV